MMSLAPPRTARASFVAANPSTPSGGVDRPNHDSQPALSCFESLLPLLEAELMSIQRLGSLE